MKDKYIGKTGTIEREEYGYKLRMDVLGEIIKAAGQERHLTQEELGRLIGVQKRKFLNLKRMLTVQQSTRLLRFSKH